MANEIKIKQTNLNNGVETIGKFYPNIAVFTGIKAYAGEDKRTVMEKLTAGETEFIVSGDIAEIKYEVI